MSRVFLTGGTGLVGSHVARLLRERGQDVVCLQRASSDTARLRALGCRIVEGDLRARPDETARAMAGCTGLVHSAALVYPRADWPTLRDVNVDGTRRVFRAAALAGVKRGVHLSSVAVYDEGASLYARSKKEAEEVVLATCRKSGPEVCVLRPAGIYGEGDRALTPTLARLVRLPVTPLLGPGNRSVPVVYAGNVADAVVRVLDAGEATGRVFDMGEDDPVTQREVYEGLAGGMGATTRFLHIPLGWAEGVARLWDATGRRLIPGGGASLLRLVRLAGRGNPFDSRKLREELGWRPPFGRVEALERTGRWIERETDDHG